MAPASRPMVYPAQAQPLRTISCSASSAARSRSLTQPNLCAHWASPGLRRARSSRMRSLPLRPTVGTLAKPGPCACLDPAPSSPTRRPRRTSRPGLPPTYGQEPRSAPRSAATCALAPAGRADYGVSSGSSPTSRDRRISAALGAPAVGLRRAGQPQPRPRPRRAGIAAPVRRSHMGWWNRIAGTGSGCGRRTSSCSPDSRIP
jgi:hypothetical protein